MKIERIEEAAYMMFTIFATVLFGGISILVVLGVIALVKYIL